MPGGARNRPVDIGNGGHAASGGRNVPGESVHADAVRRPLGGEHLSPTGDYAWDAEDPPAPGELRPLRSKPSLLAA